MFMRREVVGRWEDRRPVAYRGGGGKGLATPGRIEIPLRMNCMVCDRGPLFVPNMTACRVCSHTSGHHLHYRRCHGAAADAHSAAAGMTQTKPSVQHG